MTTHTRVVLPGAASRGCSGGKSIDPAGRSHEPVLGVKGPGEDLPALVEHVAPRVHHRQRGHGHPVVQPSRARPEPALAPPGPPPQLAHRGAGAGPDAPHRVGLLPRRPARRVAVVRPGAPGVAGDAQVVDARRRHDRNPRHAGVVPQALLLAPAHDARGGIQAEGAPAGQEERRDGVDRGLRRQQFRLAGRGAAAPHLGRPHRSRRGDHHGAAGAGRGVGPVAHAHARHGAHHGGGASWQRGHQ